ncbi:MAG TPA: hypothetical protein VMR59_01520 [Patescibacteria group bacterium]|nr:hypothetical protein [Patescibacteria group bacterium]
MIFVKRMLILEDNYIVLSKLLEKLSTLEDKQPFEFSLTVINDSEQVENLINNNPKAKFDIIILDRDCKINESFHILDIEHMGVEKVIAISAVTRFNKQLEERGVTKVIEKDLSDIDKFTTKVVNVVGEMIQKLPWS